MSERPLFIHIPKSAGFYTTAVFRGQIGYHVHARCTSDEFVEKHCSHRWVRDLTQLPNFDKMIKFTVIRNPFDLLVSYMEYRWGWHLRGRIEQLPRLDTIELIKEYVKEDKEWHVPMLKKFLYWQLFDDEGNSKCDYAIIYDKLNEGLKEFADLAGIKFTENVGKRNTSRRKHKDYRDYYDDELRTLVEEKCKRELDMFNFTFDGYQGEKALVKMSDFKVDWGEIGLDPEAEQFAKWFALNQDRSHRVNRSLNDNEARKEAQEKRRQAMVEQRKRHAEMRAKRMEENQRNLPKIRVPEVPRKQGFTVIQSADRLTNRQIRVK